MESHISPRLRAAAIAVLALLVAAGALAYAATRDTAFRMFTQDGVSYARATVSRVVSERLTPEEATGRSVGAQELEVAIESGPYAGETVQVGNNLTATHNVHARTGTKIVLKIERQPGVSRSTPCSTTTVCPVRRRLCSCSRRPWWSWAG